MFTKKWRTSERKYDIIVERDVRIRMRDGITLDADIFRPDAKEKFPAICGFHIFRKDLQSAPIQPVAFNLTNGGIEAGDHNFFVRRGYGQVIVSQRGTGNSGGKWCMYSPDEQQDTYEVVEWVARQPWCDGNVGTHGPSVFSITAQQLAALNPPNLKCIFAPWGYTDFYRDKYYHGGILSYAFTKNLIRHPFRLYNWTREKVGDKKFKELIDEALQDNDLASIPFLTECLRNPEKDRNPLIVDLMLNRLEGPYWQERSIKLDAIKVPSYIGACWGTYGLHMCGAFHAWEQIKAPKKMIIGPPIYMDRPVYQLQYEALRWFDHWLKGMETGIMEEPPIRLFVPGTGEWRASEEWPLSETKWTPFYLHFRGLLSEHEFYPNEGYSTFEDSPLRRESLTFLTPPLVEHTEVIGPITLNLYASTTDDEILWFISLLDVDPKGEEKLLTRGWLRGSQRALDRERSKPWEPFHLHTKREPLKPGEIYEFNIGIGPAANLFKEGHRIGLRIKCVDDEEPKTALETFSTGHVWRDRPSMVTIYHNANYPSCLMLPITKGNIIGTYMSGGDVPPVLGKIVPRWL
jgi:predicted acyl esterase